MRCCEKCGSKIYDNSSLCPKCQNMTAIERRKYSISSIIIFAFVFIISTFHAGFYIYRGMKEFNRLISLGSDYRPPSDFINLTRNELLLNYITVFIMYCILPFSFLIFTFLISVKRSHYLLLIFPVTGIMAELAQLAQQYHNYMHVIKEKRSYLYGVIGMDLFSALLITAFFIAMILFILRGHSISQSRWMIVLGFVFVFGRLMMKLYFYDDEELIPNFNELKGYLLFSATLLNVKKRYIISKSL